MSTAYQPYNEYSAGGGGFESTDSRGGASEDGAASRSTLTPVTIKQILDSKQLVQDGPFVSHNQELHSISFVGVVRNITDHTSNIFLTIEDGTGQIEVRKWSEDAADITTSQEENPNKDSQVAKQYEIGSYVKVYGALKEFGGKKNIQYAVIKNIASFNEVISHHLEVMKCHAIANGKIQSDKQGTDQGENQNGQSLFVNDTESGSSGNPLQKILTFCQQQCAGKDANSFAIPIQLMSQSLNIDETTVRECCNTLTEQGFIYPTFDDNNFFAL